MQIPALIEFGLAGKNPKFAHIRRKSIETYCPKRTFNDTLFFVLWNGLTSEYRAKNLFFDTVTLGA